MKSYRDLRMVTKIVLPVATMLVCMLGILAWQIQTKSSAVITSIAQRELTFDATSLVWPWLHRPRTE